MSDLYENIYLLIKGGILPSETATVFDFIANIMTRIKQNQYISSGSVEKFFHALNYTVDEMI